MELSRWSKQFVPRSKKEERSRLEENTGHRKMGWSFFDKLSKSKNIKAIGLEGCDVPLLLFNEL